MRQQAYLPVPTRYDHLATPLNRLRDVEGKAFAVLNNGWACMDELTLYLEEELRRAGASDVYHFKTPHAMPSPQEHLDEIASKVAGAITGLGN